MLLKQELAAYLRSIVFDEYPRLHKERESLVLSLEEGLCDDIGLDYRTVSQQNLPSLP